MASAGLTLEDREEIPKAIAKVILRRRALVKPYDAKRFLLSPVSREHRAAIDRVIEFAPGVMFTTNNPEIMLWFDSAETIGCSACIRLGSTFMTLPYALANPRKSGLGRDGRFHPDLPAPGFEADYEQGAATVREMLHIARDARTAFRVVEGILEGCTTTAQVRHYWPELCDMVVRLDQRESVRKRFNNTGTSRARVDPERTVAPHWLTMRHTVTIAVSKALMLPEKRPDHLHMHLDVQPNHFLRRDKATGKFAHLHGAFFWQ